MVENDIKKKHHILMGCSYSVVVITLDFESEDPSSNLGRSYGRPE